MNTTYQNYQSTPVYETPVVCERPTVETEKPSLWERICEAFAVTHVVMHFVPIVTSLCWIIFLIFGQNETLLGWLAPFMALGIVSGLLTHPIKILWAMLKRIGKAFLAPLMIPFFPVNLALAGFCGGAVIAGCLALLLFAPAVMPLYYFFNEE